MFNIKESSVSDIILLKKYRFSDLKICIFNNVDLGLCFALIDFA